MIGSERSFLIFRGVWSSFKINPKYVSPDPSILFVSVPGLSVLETGMSRYLCVGLSADLKMATNR